jgi:SpoVK/Ycf46/Vps4 family AAA+-type ATPase
MVRRNLEFNELWNMVLKSYKTEGPWCADDTDDDGEWIGFGQTDDENTTTQTSKRNTMKNIFIDSTIKKQKFSKEILEKIEFADINPLMEIVDGFEGYLGAYSEIEFLAYRFQKVHKIYPDTLRVQHVNTEKFLTELFKFAKVPDNAFYKSIEDKRGKIILNSIIFSFKTVYSNLYVYMDHDEAVFFYDKRLEKDKENTFNKLLSLLKGVVTPSVTKNKIFVVYQAQHGFEKTGFDVKKIKVDLDENYNDGFPEVSEEIVTGLNDKKKSNLVILSGEPGTGKTTYIRYLTSKIKKNIIFIAPDMVNHITDPSFIPFLIKNNDTVLIIEDGEPALQSRNGDGRTGAVSNILNLTDGLLSDCLNISILVTFNMEGKDIDKALLRKGRLLKNYKFELLSIEKSKALLKKLGRTDVEVVRPMTLADIYYEGDNNAKAYERRRVGFGN